MTSTFLESILTGAYPMNISRPNQEDGMLDDKPALNKELDSLEVQAEKAKRLIQSLRAENQQLKDEAARLPVVLIRCESRSTDSEHERGYHQYLTTITGYQAEYYAPIEFEREKKQSMWCKLEQKSKTHFEIRHGYDSSD